MQINNPDCAYVTPLRDLSNCQNEFSQLSGFISERYQGSKILNDDSFIRDQSKSVRELNVENMKLTEEIIKQNLDQASSIEKISNDRSKLFLMLNEQKQQNKKLLEQNQLLLAQLNNGNSQRNSRSLSPCSATRRSTQGQTIRLDRFKNLNLLLGGKETSEEISPERLRYSASIGDVPRQSYFRDVSPSVSQRDVVTGRLFQDTFSGYDVYQLNDIALLQNHISLLEKENDLLKREVMSAKQLHSHAALHVRELELEVDELTKAKETLIKENEELREFLKERTEEANRTITQLAEINRDLDAKAQTYQQAVDKLTAELYSMAQNSEIAKGKSPPTSSSKRDKLNKENLTPTHPNRANNSSKTEEAAGKEEMILCRRENFKLKADNKALTELIEALRKENDDLLKERMQPKESFNLGINPWDSHRTWSSVDPQSAKHVGNLNLTHPAPITFTLFRSPEMTTRSMMNICGSQSDLKGNNC